MPDHKLSIAPCHPECVTVRIGATTVIHRLATYAPTLQLMSPRTEGHNDDTHFFKSGFFSNQFRVLIEIKKPANSL